MLLLYGLAFAAAQPKHAVVFLIDDLGCGDTGHKGAEYPTANIDGLATKGIVLNQSYVMQLCSPTRSSLLSSRYSYNIGMDSAVLTGGDIRCQNLTYSQGQTDLCYSRRSHVAKRRQDCFHRQI